MDNSLFYPDERKTCRIIFARFYYLPCLRIQTKDSRRFNRSGLRQAFVKISVQ